MPGGDGTGPFGQGPGTGRGMGRGGGQSGMGGNRAGAGPGGWCVCPSCHTKVEHRTGTPCYSVTCTRCDARMVRA